ncbi:MAG: hypothetical protein D6736_07310, partial [Nitrospinota bacterium]
MEEQKQSGEDIQDFDYQDDEMVFVSEHRRGEGRTPPVNRRRKEPRRASRRWGRFLVLLIILGGLGAGFYFRLDEEILRLWRQQWNAEIRSLAFAFEVRAEDHT